MNLIRYLLPPALAPLALLLASPLQSASTRPNFILIMADDLGYSDLGCYGSEIDTPNLDQLASHGLRFTQFYNTAKCHSSRVSLLTGLYCDQAGGEALTYGATLAEALSQAGYSTAMSGKWHLSQQPTDFGFQYYWGHLSGAVNYFTGDNSFRLNGNPWDVPETLNGRPFYTTHAITDFALQFLDQITSPPNSTPFLLYLAYNAPHYPLQAPEPDVRKYKGRFDAGWDQLRLQRHQRQIQSGLLPSHLQLSPRPEHIPAWDTLTPEQKAWETTRMETYAAMVDLLDQNIGRLIAHLKKQDLWDNTLLLFCSDNGACPFERTRGKEFPSWDARSYWTYDPGWAHLGNTPFRLYKQNQHEGGISTPLIVNWPDGLTCQPGPGIRKAADGSWITDQTGHLIDFMATCLDLGRAKYPQQIGSRKMDPLMGKSLAPIFQGQVRPPHPSLYFHFGTDRAWREDQWKLVSAKLGRWELYDLSTDRSELHDLSTLHPERVRQMASRWFNFARDTDRLSNKGLAPVKETLSDLKF